MKAVRVTQSGDVTLTITFASGRSLDVEFTREEWKALMVDWMVQSIEVGVEPESQDEAYVPDIGTEAADALGWVKP